MSGQRQAEPLPTATPARTRAGVRELVGRQRWSVVAALLAITSAAAASLVSAPIVGNVIDAVVAGERWSHLITALVVVALAQGLLVIAGSALVTRLAERSLADLRETYVERVLDQPLGRIERAGDGDLTSRVADDVTLVGEAAQSAVPEFTRAVLMIALTGVGLAVLDWRFLLAGLVAVPIQAATAVWYARQSGSRYTEQRRVAGELQDQLLDTVGGIRTVLAYQMEAAQLRAITDHSSRLVRTVRRVVDLHTRFFVLLNAAEFLSLATALVTGFLLVRSGDISIGVASAAALYVIALFGPINQALFVLDALQSATASLARLFGVIDLPPAEQRAVSSGPGVDGTIRVSGLGHAYQPGHEVLAGIDLVVAEGERVALVGESGAGKTTLATLLAGMHIPTLGAILLGGAGPSCRGVAGRPVALVTQEVHVFAGTVEEDLRLANPSASGSALRSALVRVGALEWVDALPAGVETVVGRGGHRLTSVQAQQLALARLILAAPRVAVLDEATAEAGSAGAAVLERAVNEAVRGRTAVVVAHRLSQAENADLVLVLHQGRIVERGRHDDLVAARGRYAAMWASWSNHRATDLSASRRA